LLVALQAITAGDLTVSVDGTTYPTTAIDLSGATSLSNVATLLTTAIITANTALDALYNELFYFYKFSYGISYCVAIYIRN